MRNQVGRVEIAGERSAGAVSLIDARSQWHRVALISGENREQAQPLLAPLYYIEKALNPYAELIKPKGSNLAAGIQEALSQNASVLMLADIGTLSGEAAKHVEEWVKKGGVLVRFAGPRLENGGDELLPVPLRVGGRTLGGALSWSTPQKLAPIEDTSLFAGTPVPPEVTVSRQVLADPAMLGPDVHVWARLQDGTPLVTERKLGEGQIILFHVTANSDWSNLPLSGLFVEMLRRISALGSGVADGGGTGTPNEARRAGCAEPCCRRCRRSTASASSRRRRPRRSRSPPPRCTTSCRASIIRRATTAPAARRAPSTCSAPRARSRRCPRCPPAPSASTTRAKAPNPLKSWLLLAALALLFADIIAVILLQAGGFGLWRADAPRHGARRARLGRRRRCRAVDRRARRAGASRRRTADAGRRQHAGRRRARHRGDEQGHASATC